LAWAAAVNGSMVSAPSSSAAMGKVRFMGGFPQVDGVRDADITARQRDDVQSAGHIVPMQCKP
jgi:hypothetical protein